MKNKLPGMPQSNDSDREMEINLVAPRGSIDPFDVDMDDFFDTKNEDISIIGSLITGEMENADSMHYLSDPDPDINNNIDFDYIDYSD
jgi:hypothetical protein